eukprot:2404747-Amphidinium_carterae.1
MVCFFTDPSLPEKRLQCKSSACAHGCADASTLPNFSSCLYVVVQKASGGKLVGSCSRRNSLAPRKSCA